MHAHHARRSLPLIGLGLLLGCGDDRVTDPANTITVNGSLIYRDGEPVIGAQVLVPGGAPVVSGSDGRFSLPGVEPPYDIAFVVHHELLRWAVMYQGLTRADPTLLFPFRAGPERSATISGAVPQANSMTVLGFIDADAWGGAIADASTGLYSLNASWSGGSSSRSGRLHLLRVTYDDLGAVSGYDAYASRDLTIQSDQSHGGQDFHAGELVDPPERILDGSVTVPAGYLLAIRELTLDFGVRPFVLMRTAGASLPLSFSYVVPAPAGSPVAGLHVVARGAGTEGGQASSELITGVIAGSPGAVDVALPPAGQPLEPVNNAGSVGHGTRFRWSSGGGPTGVHQIWIVPSDSSQPSFVIHTTREELTIPDLGALEMGLPSGAEYRWVVHEYFPVASLDHVADAQFLSLMRFESGMVGATGSETFTFTTRGASGSVARNGKSPLPAIERERPAGLLRPPGFLLPPR